MTTITAETLARRFQNGSMPLVLDIRDAAAFEDWHVPNSTNIDVYDELRGDPSSAKDALGQLPDEDEVVTVCGFGIVSQQATDILREMGYDAKTLEEGMAGWSQVHLSAPVSLDVPGKLVQISRPGKGCLSSLLISEGEAAVFDPSQYVEEYLTLVDEYDTELVAVFDTHAHADHLSGGYELAEAADIPYHLHEADAIDIPATPIEDGQAFTVGDVRVEALHTPGHSPGSVSFDVHGEALLTGDTLFHESVGRVELGAAVGLTNADVERNAERLYESINRLLDRDDDYVVLPAHADGSPCPPVSASVGEIPQRNPDVQQDRSEFIAELASDTPDLPPNVRQIKLANVGVEAIEDADRLSIELGPNRCAAN